MGYNLRMLQNKYQQAFFELLRAGLWEKDARLSAFGAIDYSVILRLAEEQSVVGLLTAGLEHAHDVKIPKDVLLQFVGSTIRIEQQNKSLNKYVSQLIGKLRKEDVYAVLVKGQGIANCYERPLWRSSGDVDLLLNDSGYNKAKDILEPISISIDHEFTSFKHISYTMNSGFIVELHGTLHSRLSERIDRVIDEAQKEVIYNRNVRTWINGSTQVFLPSPNEDVIFIFTHILHHFYIGGIGLRQICDWCRLLWTYRNSLDVNKLEARIKVAGLMPEWKAFGAYAVEYLGMPIKSMPFYSESNKWSKKAAQINGFVLEVGNFGHNREMKYKDYPFFFRKMCSFVRRIGDLLLHTRVFPLDSLRFFPHILISGIVTALKGE